MLHLEFAIAPSQISSIADLVILESRLGYEKGAVLSRFPKSWFREVLQKLNMELDGSKLDRATEKLRALQSSKLVALGRPFEGNAWIEAAINNHATKPFHLLVEESFNEQPIFISSLVDLGDQDFSFRTSYRREAQSLAVAASALLFGTEKVTIYDPFICATISGYRKVLLELMKICNKPVVEFHIFSEEDKKPAWELTEQALQSFVRDMPTNIKLFWYCANDHGTGFLHPRGLFTAKGGLVYDRGFVEPNSREQRAEFTDITPMASETLQSKAKSYNASQHEDFELVRAVWCSHP